MTQYVFNNYNMRKKTKRHFKLQRMQAYNDCLCKSTVIISVNSKNIGYIIDKTEKQQKVLSIEVTEHTMYGTKKPIERKSHACKNTE